MDFLNRAIATVGEALGLTTPGPRDPVQDIVQTALLLRQKLPADLVPTILDYAELWATTVTATTTRTDRISEAQSPKLQAALLVPRHIRPGTVRRITFTTVSRDQGWSDYAEDHGTYRGSWTWFEAGMRGLDATNSNDLETIDMNVPVNCQHRNALDLEHRELCQSHNGYYKYGSKRIVTNEHAGREFKEHHVVWDLNSLDDSIRKMLIECRGGSRVEVAAYAQFQGWVNYVANVDIKVEAAVVRRM